MKTVHELLGMGMATGLEQKRSALPGTSTQCNRSNHVPSGAGSRRILTIAESSSPVRLHQWPTITISTRWFFDRLSAESLHATGTRQLC